MGMFDTVYICDRVTKDTSNFSGGEVDIQTKDLDKNLNILQIDDNLLLSVIGTHVETGLDDGAFEPYGDFCDKIKAGKFTGVLRTNDRFYYSDKDLHYAFTNNRLNFVAHIYTFGNYPVISRDDEFDDTFFSYDAEGNMKMEFLKHNINDDDHVVEMFNRVMLHELGTVKPVSKRPVTNSKNKVFSRDEMMAAAKSVIKRYHVELKKLSDK